MIRTKTFPFLVESERKKKKQNCFLPTFVFRATRERKSFPVLQKRCVNTYDTSRERESFMYPYQFGASSFRSPAKLRDKWWLGEISVKECFNGTFVKASHTRPRECFILFMFFEKSIIIIVIQSYAQEKVWLLLIDGELETSTRRNLTHESELHLMRKDISSLLSKRVEMKKKETLLMGGSWPYASRMVIIRSDFDWISCCKKAFKGKDYAPLSQKAHLRNSSQPKRTFH